MSIPGSATPLLLATTAAAPAAAHQIDRSLRFNSADSAYLNRTPSSAGNRKTFTFSCWVKRVKDAADPVNLFAAGGNRFRIAFGVGNTAYLQVYDYTGSSFNFNKGSAASYRDFSAWYHVVVAIDTTDSTADDRVKMYINGSRITDLYTGTNINPSQNLDTHVNSTSNEHYIGYLGDNTNYLDAYLADVHFIDGQALAPTDFGEYDSNNNWNPKDTSGLTFGTNGFHLDFADPADLGDDNSGNGNDWTPNNLVGSAGLATADQGFGVVTYTGTNSSQSITGLNFQPDFIWFKARSYAGSHALVDSVRGISKQIQSNTVNAESTNSSGAGPQSFDSNGFTLGTESSATGSTNGSQTYVAWCWKAGGAASSNTDGTETTSVSANTTYGFSIVTYTGTSSADTFGHGLGAVPKMIFFKARNAATNWQVYHDDGTNKRIFEGLNTTGTGGTTINNMSSMPSSTLLSLAGGGYSINSSGKNMVAYCWSEISGFSKFGSYTGTGSANVSVTTGFKPSWVMIKEATTTNPWYLYDNTRGTTNILWANASSSESDIGAGDGTNQNGLTITDDGFTIPHTLTGTNRNGGTFIYAAFADKPDGSVIDSLIDTPTNYDAASGNNGGNYATLNVVDKGSSITLSNGNLDISKSGTTWANSAVRGTIGISSGKWYWEITKTNASAYSMYGVAVSAASFSEDYGAPNNETWTYISNSGNKFGDSDGGGGASYGATFTDGDIIGVALDMDAGTLVFYKNGSSQGTAYSTLSGKTIFPWIDLYNSGDTASVNFGQRPFAYTPPTGYKSLCTQNLTDPTIADGSAYFDIDTYQGTGSTHERSEFSFSPDFVWIKGRSFTGAHMLFDSVRGATKRLVANQTLAEGTVQGVTSFDSDGFTLGNDADCNFNNHTLVAWAWDGGTSTVSNTDGSITSSVRANASAGFSIVAYTGTGTAGTIGHGLNAAPSLVIAKSRSATGRWTVYSSATGAGNKLYLDGTDSSAGSSNWNNTAPTSSVFSVGGSVETNTSTVTYVAYCFSPVSQYSAVGSYTGNGSADGPFVFTGFRPALLAIKRTDSTGAWKVLDTSRSPFNVASEGLDWNTSGSEFDNSENNVDILSNGFKLKTSHGARNASGGTFIYMAWAEHPLKTSRAR